jgi:AmmeMemoRadiSam system protein B
LGRFQLGLTIGIDPALHGAGDDVHLEGLDTSRRGLVINDPKHCAIGYTPGKSADELIEILRDRLPIGSRYGIVHSLQFISSMREVVAVTLPTPVRGSGTREPVLGGKFYPAEDAARRATVDELLREPARDKKKAHAVMVPHAGLKFSGAVAADAWQSVEIPKSIVIISPKHTQAGVNWAVCPFDTWKLSTSVRFANDSELAQTIVRNMPGLQFDVAAHEQEHGIEIQLPILERVAPDVKIVGLALHGGTWSEIEKAAEGLAEALRSLPERPLLVISSDMNHFADDAENRRLDRIALDAFKSGNPQLLLDTCREQQISMCGVVPAALVMATLHKLGQAFTVEELNYATSADHGGEKSRVVGYAGARLV